MSDINKEIIEYLETEKLCRVEGINTIDIDRVRKKWSAEVDKIDKWIKHLAIGVDKSIKPALHKQSVINWVALSEKRPDTEWGDLLVCLENEAIFIANYSRIGNERWLIVGMGEITNDNPVKYWAKLPEPPCL